MSTIDEMIEAERKVMSQGWATYEQVNALQVAVAEALPGPTVIDPRDDRIVVTIWRDGQAALDAAGLVHGSDGQTHDKLCLFILDPAVAYCTCGSISQARREGGSKS